MHSRSDAFDVAVRYGGSVAYSVRAQRVDVTSGAETTTVDGLEVIGSPVVQIDTSAASRRSLNVDIADDDGTLAPLLQVDPLSPYGNELVVESGFWLAGVDELLPLGVFRIMAAKAAGDGVVRLSLLDRSVVIKEARFEEPYVIADGTNTVAAIEALLLSRYPGLTFESETTLTTVPLTVFQEGSTSGDPWANAQQLAVSAGMEVFFGSAGQVVIRRTPDPSIIPPVWTYEPSADSLLLGSENELQAEGVYNIAVVTGEGTNIDPPLRGRAQVTDASSPIHPSSFGPRPIFLSTSLATTQAQVDDAALALLARKAGGSERLQFRAAPHPAHDGGDVVRVVNEELGLDTNVVLAKFGVPVLLDVAVAYDTTARRTA